MTHPTKEQRLMAVTCAMTQSERENGDTFYHFTDTAPQSLRDLYLENYEVRDIDYEIFSKACDAVAEVSLDNLKDYEFEGEYASVYTSDRLEYLSIHNENEVFDMIGDFGAESISNACAYWYERSVQNACWLIRDYVLA